MRIWNIVQWSEIVVASGKWKSLQWRSMVLGKYVCMITSIFNLTRSGVKEMLDVGCNGRLI